MQRRRFNQTEPLQDRIASFAREAREKASRLPPGPERDTLLKKARLADTGGHLEDWTNSSASRPPKR
jgi:hypothetical protein